MEKNCKLLSIVIVNYNTASFVYKCLESIQKGNYPSGEIEVFIVDNASEEKLDKNILEKYRNIELIRSSKNLGFSKANNLALKKVKGDYVLLLNPDTILLKDTLSKMVDYMNSNSDIGISTCKVELSDGKIDDACHRGFPTPWNAFCYFSGISRIFSKSMFFNGYHLGYQDMEDIHEIDSCAGAFMLVKRSLGEKLGWFDEDYFWYGEDIDFCYRAKTQSAKVAYYPFVKIIHFKGVSAGIKNHSQNYSKASYSTKIKATKARYEVMRIFYEKHYKDKYHVLVRNSIYLGISLKEKLSLIKVGKEQE